MRKTWAGFSAFEKLSVLIGAGGLLVAVFACVVQVALSA